MINIILDIALFRAGPDKFPYSRNLLALLILSLIALRMLFTQLVSSTVVAIVLSSVLIPLVLLYLLLSLYNKVTRFVQLASTLLTFELIFGVLSLLILQNSFLIYVSLCWFAAIKVFIYKRGIDASLPEAILVFLVITLIYSVFIYLQLPQDYIEKIKEAAEFV